MERMDSTLNRRARHLLRGLTWGTMLLVLGLGAAPAAGQLTTGNIVGTVVDETGAALPGAAVTITNVSTGLSRTVITTDTGRYEATSLPTGPYEVTATMSGFGTAVRKGIDLTIGRTAVVDLKLPLQAVKEEVVVTADVPLVETTSATVSSLIDAKARRGSAARQSRFDAARLPPARRDQESLPVPGSLRRTGRQIHVAGARGTQNLYLLDGVSNADLSGNPQGASGCTPAPRRCRKSRSSPTTIRQSIAAPPAASSAR